MQVSGELEAHTPFERGDALLFVSHKPHCVAPVTAGLRKVLVMELWEGEERNCPARCNTPWGGCTCAYDREHTAA